MRYAARTDSCHAEIRDGLRDVFGSDAVQDVSMYPRLGFELIAVTRGRLMLLEVKTPATAMAITGASSRRSTRP